MGSFNPRLVLEKFDMNEFSLWHSSNVDTISVNKMRVFLIIHQGRFVFYYPFSKLHFLLYYNLLTSLLFYLKNQQILYLIRDVIDHFFLHIFYCAVLEISLQKSLKIELSSIFLNNLSLTWRCERAPKL